jgi:hypothetical protein
MNRCLKRVYDRNFWTPGVFSYAMIPRCRPDSRVFFHHHIHRLWFILCIWTDRMVCVSNYNKQLFHYMYHIANYLKKAWKDWIPTHPSYNKSWAVKGNVELIWTSSATHQSINVIRYKSSESGNKSELVNGMSAVVHHILHWSRTMSTRLIRRYLKRNTGKKKCFVVKAFCEKLENTRQSPLYTRRSGMILWLNISNTTSNMPQQNG